MYDEYWDDDEYETWRDENKDTLLGTYCAEHDDWEITMEFMLEDEDWLAKKFEAYKRDGIDDLIADREDWKYD